jgi:hypothetical protein
LYFFVSRVAAYFLQEFLLKNKVLSKLGCLIEDFFEDLDDLLADDVDIGGVILAGEDEFGD